MPKVNIMPNYLFSICFFENQKSGSNGNMPFFVSKNYQSFDEYMILMSSSLSVVQGFSLQVYHCRTC
jgi:hypothetical protein